MKINFESSEFAECDRLDRAYTAIINGNTFRVRKFTDTNGKVWWVKYDLSMFLGQDGWEDNETALYQT